MFEGMLKRPKRSACKDCGIQEFSGQGTRENCMTLQNYELHPCSEISDSRPKLRHSAFVTKTLMPRGDQHTINVSRFSGDRLTFQKLGSGLVCVGAKGGKSLLFLL